MSKVFRVILEGAQEVPSVSTSAGGVGTIVFDEMATTATYDILVRGVDFSALGAGTATAGTGDDLTSMHVHNQVRGMNGSVVFGQFSPAQDTAGGGVSFAGNADGSVTVSGVWDTMDPASMPLTNFVAALNATAIGADAPLYFNVHTVDNPGGAVRGQWVAIADENANTVYGGNDSDLLPTLGGDDIVIGLEGNDSINGGEGNDLIAGGDDNDSISGGAGNDTLYGENGTDSLFGGDGSDYADGGDNSDVVDGGAGADTVHGGDGDDQVLGGADDDFVSGGPGNDFVDGGAGVDIVLGGNGMDTLTGGNDLDFDRVVTTADLLEDVILMNAPGAQAAGLYDQVENFEAGIDKIDVRTTGADGFEDIGFSDYAGVGVKIIAPDGSANFFLGVQQADVQADWFLFA